AVGNAVLDVVMADGFLEHMRKNALLLKQRLAELKDRHASVIAEVRGEGLLIGLRMIPQASEMVDELRADKMITVAAGDNVLRCCRRSSSARKKSPRRSVALTGRARVLRKRMRGRRRWHHDR
ncbi:MAG: aminotransferase class III-fold pyridoxal phosphate-dependent enzyme, partial [Pseudolabrys sp.]